MQHDITKLCADSLRVFTLDNHGIKLKPSHAHESVAAFFGYQSKAALLADAATPLNNLHQAEFILVNPDTRLAAQRIKSLQPDLPDAVSLIQGVYSALFAEQGILEKIWPTFHDLANHLAEQRLHQKSKMWRIDLKAIKWDMDVDIEHKEDGVLLTVDVGYRTEAGERLKESEYIITLPRMAANLGYGKPIVRETRYSGRARSRIA